MSVTTVIQRCRLGIFLCNIPTRKPKRNFAIYSKWEKNAPPHRKPILSLPSQAKRLQQLHPAAPLQQNRVDDHRSSRSAKKQRKALQLNHQLRKIFNIPNPNHLCRVHAPNPLHHVHFLRHTPFHALHPPYLPIRTPHQQHHVLVHFLLLQRVLGLQQPKKHAPNQVTESSRMLNSSARVFRAQRKFRDAHTQVL